MTDQNKKIMWTAEFDPFGNLVSDVAYITNNLRFPGQYFDYETGLNYNSARYYKASIGRYTQADPIGLVGGMNRYAYVQNNPVMMVDTTGLSAQEGGGMVLGASTSSDHQNSYTGGWEYFSWNGIQYRARKIKEWDNLSPWEKAQLLLHIIVGNYSSIPGSPGGDQLQIFDPGDPRYQIDEGSFQWFSNSKEVQT